MDDIERRLAVALKARAAEVTDGSLRDLVVATSGRPVRRGRLVIAAVGFAAVIVAALLVVPAVFQGWRVTGTPTAAPIEGCDANCRLVQQTTFAGDTLVVLNRARPAEWELRTRGVLITSSKQFPLPLANRPLRCWELLSTPYCLLRLDGPPNESTYGLLSRVGATWTVVRGVVFSNRATVEVKDLGPATVALVAVEQVDDGRWHSVVMLWTEPSRRCSPLVATKEQLPGWPDVRPGLQDLNPC